MSTQNSTPRQKMINMMYLVLTALLALNVSAEVIRAFTIVNDSIAKSNTTLYQNNELLQKQFVLRMNSDPKKVAPIQAKALQAKQVSSTTYQYLEKIKNEIVTEAGGYDLRDGSLRNADDINIPTRYFVENNGKRGKALKKQLDESRTELLQLIDDKTMRQDLENQWKAVEEGSDKSKSWEYNTFNHMPTVAAITMLSKYQNDVRNAEAKILEQLYKSIDASDYKVDAMKACVMASSNRLLQGDVYNAEIMVAAYSSTQSPKVYLGSFTSAVKRNSDGTFAKIEHATAVPLNNARIIESINGIAHISMNASSMGQQRYSGVVEVKNPSGTGFDYYPFEGAYEVSPKMASISPTMMNVLYVGVENPLDIAAGATGCILQPKITLGSIQKMPDGKYNATFTTPGNAEVIVNATLNGKTFEMGRQKFRILRLPTPIPSINGVPPGAITKERLATLTGVTAIMPPDFVYQIKPKVLSYKVTILKKEGVIEVNGTEPMFPEKVTKLLKTMKKDEAVFIESIKVMMPDKEVRTLPNITYLVKS